MSRTPFHPDGSEPNQLVTYTPSDEIPELRYPEDRRLSAYAGSIDVQSVSIQSIELLPIPTVWDLESCMDWHEYKRNSHKGRRREHALYLAAKALDRDVVILQHMLDATDRIKCQALLTKLAGLVLGKRYNLNKSTQTFIVMDQELYIEFQLDLSLVLARTRQLLGRNGFAIFPAAPVWGNSANVPLEGTYSANDWEIISAAFRFEVEAWLKKALTYGYDFVPWQDPDERDELDDGKESADDKSTGNRTPRKVNQAVVEQLTLRREGRLPSTDKKPGLDFFDLSREEPETPTPHARGKKRRGKGGDSKDEHVLPSHLSNPNESLANAIADNPFLVDLLKDAVNKSASSPLREDQKSPKKPIVDRHPDRAQEDSAYIDQLKKGLGEKSIDLQSAWPRVPQEGDGTLPHYQDSQIRQVYGSGSVPADVTGFRPTAGTQLFNDLWKPSKYAPNNRRNEPTTPGRNPASGANSTPLGNRSQHTNRAQFNHPDDKKPEREDQSGNGNGGNNQPPYNPPPTGDGGGNPSDDSDHDGNGDNRRGGGEGRRDAGRNRQNERNEDNRPLRPDGFPEPDPDKDPEGTAAWRDFKDRIEPWVKLVSAGENKWINVNETHFDTKLKSDIIPLWDGNHEELGRWILLINDIADRSASAYRGLGDVVPTRFSDKAASWWFSLPEAHRRSVMINWDTLKDEIRTYWMNQAYIDKMQSRAIRA